MQENERDIILAKYITGEADSDEIVAIEQWLSMNASNMAHYIQLKAVWHAMHFNEMVNDDTVESTYRSLLQKNAIPAHSVFRLNFRRFSVAAVVLALLSAAVFLYFMMGSKPEAKTNYSQQIIVSKGDKKKIVLKDGTVVWLNAASMLHIDDNFGTTNRNVYLEGEGYFEVAHNKNLVFTINTKYYTVKDIGTSFNVISYPSESIFETAVIDGEVSVEGRFEKSNKLSTIYLSKNAVLKVKNTNAVVSQKTESNNNTAPEVIVKNTASIDNYIGWKDDMLVFDNDLFSEIAKRLERKYNVVIVIDDLRLNNYHYTGSFNKIENITKVFDIIKETTPISYDLSADTVTIHHK